MSTQDIFKCSLLQLSYAELKKVAEEYGIAFKGNTPADKLRGDIEAYEQMNSISRKEATIPDDPKEKRVLNGAYSVSNDPRSLRLVSVTCNDPKSAGVEGKTISIGNARVPTMKHLILLNNTQQVLPLMVVQYLREQKYRLTIKDKADKGKGLNSKKVVHKELPMYTVIEDTEGLKKYIESKGEINVTGE